MVAPTTVKSTDSYVYVLTRMENLGIRKFDHEARRRYQLISCFVESV